MDHINDLEEYCRHLQLEKDKNDRSKDDSIGTLKSELQNIHNKCFHLEKQSQNLVERIATLTQERDTLKKHNDNLKRERETSLTT